MSLLIETISCVDGKLQNLFWHTARVNRSRSVLFESSSRLTLDKTTVPDFVQSGKWKCRVIYDKRINGVSFEPYISKEVNSLRLVESTIDYSHKYEDRRALDELFEQRGGADEIIIVKNGFITDTSIANILLFDGKDWITPESPILFGTMRAELLSKKAIIAKPVTVNELYNYEKIMLVNAMNPFDLERAIDINSSVK